jgi:hypothetical protein
MEIEYDSHWQNNGSSYGSLAVFLCTMAFWSFARRKYKGIDFTSYGKDDSTGFLAKSKGSFSVGDCYSKIFLSILEARSMKVCFGKLSFQILKNS